MLFLSPVHTSWGSECTVEFIDNIIFKTCSVFQWRLLWTLGGSRLGRKIHCSLKCEHVQKDVNNENLPGLTLGGSRLKVCCHLVHQKSLNVKPDNLNAFTMKHQHDFYTWVNINQEWSIICVFCWSGDRRCSCTGRGARWTHGILQRM